MELVTGKAGRAHITSEQLGAGYAGIVGSGQYVSMVGSMMAATVQGGSVRIADGDAWLNGRHVTIPHGTYDEVAIDMGTSGYNRNDIVAIRYTRDASTGIEGASLVAVKGTPASGAAADPECSGGSVIDGALVVDMPLWRIPLAGTAIGEPVALFDVVASMDDLMGLVAALQGGKADASHDHAASAITSGTLGVARGGTGKAAHTSNAVLTGNGSGAVGNVASASGALYATGANAAPSFGTLPVAQGGTGSTSASAARSALGAAASSHTHSAADIASGVLAVANGGTGAATTSKNRVLASPDGSSGAPSFRALVADDVPSLPASKIASGALAAARGGTGASTAAANKVLAGPSGGNDAAPSFRALVANDLPSVPTSKITGTLPVAQGGTGKASTSAGYVFAGPSGESGAPGFRKLVASDVPAVAASAVTGVLPVAHGGTGAATVGKNKVFAGHKSNDGTAPSFRALDADDIPSLPASKIGSGTLPVARGGTGAATASANRVLAGPSSGSSASAPSFRSLVSADLPDIPATKIAGTLGTAHGGTGASTASANRIFAAPDGESGAPSFRKIVSDDITSVAASKVTGTLALSKGGSGSDGTETVSTASSIISPVSGITIESAVYSVWGKVAQLNLNIKPSSAKSGTWDVGTIASGKRPKSMAIAAPYAPGIDYASVTAAGLLRVTGSLAANAAVAVELMYLLP